MCRLAAYLGPSVSLNKFLLFPSHSLVKQSWAPKEMQEAVLNADGYGLGWYSVDGKAATYKNNLPIWSDINLDSLSDSLSSSIWLANIRSATPGQDNSLANTQPFVDDDIFYLHNGYVENFIPEIRIRFHDHLKPDIQASIQGNTDSEYLFAMVRQHYKLKNKQLSDCLLSAVSDLTKLIYDKTALLNFIMSDGEKFYVIRHALNNNCPTLYYTQNDESYPDSVLVASECLTESASWQPVPEHSLLILSKNSDPEIVSL